MVLTQVKYDFWTIAIIYSKDDTISITYNFLMVLFIPTDERIKICRHK